MKIASQIEPVDLLPRIRRMWELSAKKILLIEKTFNSDKGAPVFTVRGRYTTRGWTEWTQGFQHGAAILQFDATDDKSFLDLGRRKTIETMAGHVTHLGVHDHGFNNVSTYGNLLRLMNEGRIPETTWERQFYQMALKCSGAVQAARWTRIHNGAGFIYSFNGPQSLFVDTIRSLRVLAIAHRLGHVLMGENDQRVSLLERLIHHAMTTATYSIYFGEGRDAYDVRGRTAHEAIFNVNDGRFRCPNSQQGFSPFSTWTRGLAWAMLGFAEELEFLQTVTDTELIPFGGRKTIEKCWLDAAQATGDFYIENTALDGIPYWDTGAPNLHRLGDWRSKPSDPFNPHEPVDSSAAAIAAQGLLRLAHRLGGARGKRYRQAGLTILNTLCSEPYISKNARHEGLLLHSVYHRPNGWDYIARGQSIPNGESSMWGDYHLREAMLYVQRLAENQPYLTFW